MLILAASMTNEKCFAYQKTKCYISRFHFGSFILLPEYLNEIQVLKEIFQNSFKIE